MLPGVHAAWLITVACTEACAHVIKYANGPEDAVFERASASPTAGWNWPSATWTAGGHPGRARKASPQRHRPGNRSGR
jgi:hypothetical protein